ncbi:short-chain dehydrogenase/reductase SDR [Mycena latifolia]|nr:short-chain dehydrogenase/reductase SDR [Mycena latifolia]
MAQIRSILITGANQGLGMNTVHQLASTPNVLVFMGSRKITAAEESLASFASDIHTSSSVLPVQVDITDESSIKAAHATIVHHLKARNLSGLDVLINNAGVLNSSFKETFEANVFGTVAVTENIRLLLNPGGAIINMSSGIGSIAMLLTRPGLPSIPTVPPYSASKAALNNLTVQWAMEEQKKGSGIRVMSICPGLTATAINNYRGTRSPAEACRVIVKAALEKEGRTGVFFNEDGDLPW